MRSRARSARLVAVGIALSSIAAIVIACSSFSGNSEPFDAGADEDAGTVDDAPIPPLDGAPDANDGAAPGFCVDAGTHTFCEDFDEHELADDDWALLVKNNTAGAGAILTSDASVSPPRALHFEMTSAPTGSDSNFYVAHTFAGANFRSAVVNVSIRVKKIGGTLGIDAGPNGVDARAVKIVLGDYTMEMNLTQASSGYAVNIDEFGTGVSYRAHTLAIKGSLTADLLAPDLWHEVVISVDGPTKKVAVTVDKTKALETAPIAAWQAPAMFGTSSLHLGSKTDGHGVQVIYDYDNVVVDLAP